MRGEKGKKQCQGVVRFDEKLWAATGIHRKLLSSNKGGISKLNAPIFTACKKHNIGGASNDGLQYLVA